VVKKAMKLARQRRQRLVADLAVYFDAGAPELGAPVVIVDAPVGLRVQRLRQRGLNAARARSQATALKFTRAHRAQAALVLDGRAPKAALQRLLSRHLRPVSS
jgi:dephospho-CoA kinase